MKKKAKLPQTYGTHINISPILVTVVGVFVVMSYLTNTVANEQLIALSQYPFNIGLHWKQVQYLEKSGQRNQSSKEIAITKELSKRTQNPQVLGISTELNNFENEVLMQPVYIQQQITYWKEIVQKNPTYVDGWEQLVYLHLTLDDIPQAQIYLNTVESLSPARSRKLVEDLRTWNPKLFE